MVERVGPILIEGAAARAVIEAIRAENAEVEVQERGSYLRVSAPGACRVTRRAIEAILDEPFHLPMDLERVMTSFKGRFRVTEEEASWSL